MTEVHSISERRACRLTELGRSTWNYRPCPRDDRALRMRLKELAYARPRYGYERLTILLQREGWEVNHKRIYRIYREEGLTVRTKRRRKRAAQTRLAPLPATHPAQRWSVDFMSDALADGRRFRVLTAVDQFTRECVVLEAGQSIPSQAVTEALDQAIRQYGKPETITIDHGTEFTSNRFDQWAYQRGIQLDFISPGRPVENGFIESFNGKLRDECLNLHWFASLAEAKRLIEAWRREYNNTRPHSSLGNRAPAEYVAELLGLNGSKADAKANIFTL